MFPGDRRRGEMNNRGGFPGFPKILGFPRFPTMGMGGSPFGSIFGGCDPFADPFFQNHMPMPMPMPGFGHNLISPFDDSDDNEKENYQNPDASFIHQCASNPPLPQQVGNAFVNQYYQVVHAHPNYAFKFYQECSKIGRLESDGQMSCTTSMDGSYHYITNCRLAF